MQSTNKNINKANAIAVKTNNLVVIDIDNIDDWHYLLSSQNIHDIDAPFEKTPNGYHLFFKKPDIIKNMKSIIKLKYNDQKLNIDILTGDSMVITSPSQYFDENNNFYQYSWIKSIHEYELFDLPLWLIKICCDSISKNKTEKSKEFLKSIKCEDTNRDTNRDTNTNTNNFCTNIITTEQNNSHIQKMIEELKSIIENIKKCKLTKEETSNIGKFLKNISTQTFFLYEKIDANAKENWVSFHQNRKGSIYNYYRFLGYIKNSNFREIENLR